jgi:hypothetical protein
MRIFANINISYMAIVKNIIGNKFGKLTVLELVDRSKSIKTRYICECDCGNIHETSGDSLRGGKSKSCGCLKKSYIPKSYNTNRHEQILIQLYKSTVLKRSKDKNWIDCISFGLFKSIVKSRCFYCNSLPNSKIEDRNKNNREGKISDVFVCVNGVDRIDSSIGYIDTNIVPCCKHCNTAKNTMTNKEFKEWIINVYNHYIKQ